MGRSRGEFQVDFLRSVLDAGGSIEKIRFSLQRGGLRSIEPIYSVTLRQGEARSLQEFPWTSELERLFLEQHVHLATDDDEAERFANILMNNLESASFDCGRDYAHAVFVEVLRDRPTFELTALLGRTATPRPSRESKHYADCRAFLEQSVDGVYATLRFESGYPPARAQGIAEQALEITLDEVFHLAALTAFASAAT